MQENVKEIKLNLLVKYKSLRFLIRLFNKERKNTDAVYCTILIHFLKSV